MRLLFMLLRIMGDIAAIGNGRYGRRLGRRWMSRSLFGRRR